MATKGMYETVKQAIQDLIAPDLEHIKGQLTGVDARIGALDKRIDGVDKRVDDGFRAVHDRIDAVRDQVEHTNRRLDDALNIRERLAVLEAKVAARG